MADPLTPAQRKYLAAYAETGRFSEAAKAAGGGRTQHYKWLKNSPEYEAAFQAAKETAAEKFEDEARRRAVEGELEYVMYQGEICLEPLLDEAGKVLRDDRGRVQYSDRPLMRRVKSDNLLMFTVKAMKPTEYRDNTQVSLATDGKPIEVEIRYVRPGDKPPEPC